MNRLFALTLALAFNSTALALEAPIQTTGTGPYFKLDLPQAIFTGLSDATLSDLRIRNAAGQNLPYAWLPSSTWQAQFVRQRLPMFQAPRPVVASSEASNLGLRVEPSGQLALVNPKATKPHTTPDLIFDASQVRGALWQATLEVPDKTEGLFAYRIDSSDDLQHWQPVAEGEQLVWLKNGDQWLKRNTLALQGLRARYLRLRWEDPTHAGPLRALQVDVLDQTEAVTPLQWSAPIAAQNCSATSCDYPLPGALALQALRVELAEANTLGELHILGLRTRRSPAPPSRRSHNPLDALRHKPAVAASGPAVQESELTKATVYRLMQSHGEARSADIALFGDNFEALRLRGNLSSFGQQPPTIRVATQTRSLAFLGRGPGPFVATWARAASSPVQPGEAISLPALMPGYTPGAPINTDEAHLQLNAPAAASTPTAVSSVASASARSGVRYGLWAGLGLGLAVLGAMVASLLANMKDAKRQA